MAAAPGNDWVGGDGARTAQRYARMAEHVASVSPSYELLCLGVASDADVVALLDTLPLPKRQPNLLLGAVRWHGGPADSYSSFRAFVLSEWPVLAATMLAKRTQTNEPRRLATLLPALGQLGDQPLALLEVGASAGLCLYPDRYAYRYDSDPVLGDSTLVLGCATEGPVPLPAALPTVAWRGGLDLNPLDVATDEDVRWLEALIWPEETERFGVLREATALARRDPAQIVSGDLTSDLVGLAARVPRDALLVVFHSAVLAYVDEDGRTAFRAQLAEIAASRPIVWLANEVPGIVVAREQVPEFGPDEFVLSRDGDPLALTESHGTRVRWLARSAREWSV